MVVVYYALILSPVACVMIANVPSATGTRRQRMVVIVPIQTDFERYSQEDWDEYKEKKQPKPDQFKKDHKDRYLSALKRALDNGNITRTSYYQLKNEYLESIGECR